jgi:hypothetical protein
LQTLPGMAKAALQDDEPWLLRWRMDQPVPSRWCACAQPMGRLRTGEIMITPRPGWSRQEAWEQMLELHP